VKGSYWRIEEIEDCAKAPHHPDRRRSDLSPQAGRGEV